MEHGAEITDKVIGAGNRRFIADIRGHKSSFLSGFWVLRSD
jgi:hypothetical protein